MVQPYGSTIDLEQLYVMFLDFVPKSVEDEILGNEFADLQRALEFVEQTLARLNGDRLAEFEENRLKGLMGQKASLPFTYAVHE